MTWTWPGVPGAVWLAPEKNRPPSPREEHWERTLAKHGITLEEMPEGEKELDQYLEMWGEASQPLSEKDTGHTHSAP